MFLTLMDDKTLYALNLENYKYRLGEPVGGSESGVNSEEDTEEDTTLISQADHLLLNQGKFNQKFPVRECTADGLSIVMVGERRTELYASCLRNNHLKPQWYRPDGFLRDGSLAGFVTHCEDDRREDHATSLASWEIVKADPNVKLLMRRFLSGVSSEQDLVCLFTAIVTAYSRIIWHCGRMQRVSSQYVRSWWSVSLH